MKSSGRGESQLDHVIACHLGPKQHISNSNRIHVGTSLIMIRNDSVPSCPE